MVAIKDAYDEMYAQQELYAQAINGQEVQDYINARRDRLRKARHVYLTAVNELNHYLSQVVIRNMEDAIYNIK
jgi:hypothetical protein